MRSELAVLDRRGVVGAEDRCGLGCARERDTTFDVGAQRGIHPGVLEPAVEVVDQLAVLEVQVNRTRIIDATARCTGLSVVMNTGADDAVVLAADVDSGE